MRCGHNRDLRFLISVGTLSEFASPAADEHIDPTSSETSEFISSRERDFITSGAAAYDK
jgi:hypothetical protein